MAFIKLTSEKPGIIGLLESFPESAKFLNELVEHLLRSDKYSMPTYAREYIAGFVSRINNVPFCEHSHTATAIALSTKAGINEETVAEEFLKYDSLLKLAEVVAKFKSNSEPFVTAAKEAGFSEEDIHLTVLITAAFCMYNRYVDGLGTEYSDEFPDYLETGARLAEKGYLLSEGAQVKEIPVEEHNV